MDRFLPDVADTLEWNLVARNNYAAVENGDGTYTPIPPLNFLIENSHICMVGVKSDTASGSWYTGGWVAQRLLMVPSSLSEFVANVQTTNQRIKLGNLNLIEFPKLMSTWMLYLKIPKWIKTATVEIWRYDGRDYDNGEMVAIASVPSQVSQSATAVQLLAASDTRRGAIIFNRSTATLAIGLGETPTIANSPTKLLPEGYYEVPFHWKGVINGIWSSAGSGQAEIRRFT